MSDATAFTTLRDGMAAGFSLGELERLCEDAGVRPDHLRHATAPELAAALLAWAAPRPDRRADLIARLRALRPAVDWPDDYALPEGGLPDAGAAGTTIIGDVVGGDKVMGDKVGGDKITQVQWTPPPPYDPPAPPAPGELPDPGPLPPGHRMTFGRNPLFTGRERELIELAAILLPTDDGRQTTDETAVVRGPSAVVSSGIGGVGKTQLAVEFAWRYGRFFHGVHWVSMENPDAVAAEIALCGSAMGLRPDFDGLPVEAQARLTLDKWAGPEARLIVFDNCEEPGLLAQWRPKGGGARLLVTSRNAVWPRSAGVVHAPLDALPTDQAVALLAQYHTPATADEAAELAEIAAELGGLPLALHLAGSYLESYAGDPKGTPAALLAELRDPELMLRGAALTGRGAADSPTDHDPHLANTFLLSMDALERRAPNVGLAMALLACAACLAPGEPFPAALLRRTIDEGIDSLDVSDALRALEQVGLLERAGSAAEAAIPGDPYRLHRLIARFVVGELAGGGAKDGDETEGEGLMAAARAEVERAVNDLAYEQLIAGDPRALREWDIHLRHVTDSAFEREDETAATLCSNLGYYLRMSGDLAGARPYYERALAVREHVLGPDHPQTASAVNNMGYLLRAMGDLAGARLYYERALGIREHVLGPEHPDTATSLNNMGYLLDSMGDLAGARPYYERALAIRERVLGPEHPDTAGSLNNLGALLDSMGDLAGARPYYERALAVRERVLGPEHPATAQSLNNMGYLLQAMGDLPAARPYYERALAVRERVLGPDHPDTARSLNNMGYLLDSMGDLAAARPYYERALGIREHVLGPEHPDTALSLNNMGYLLQAMGDLAEARPYFERALAVRERVLGPEHPDTASSLSNMGVLCYYEGNLPAAADLMRRALAIREKVLGPDHPDTRGSREGLAVIEEALRRS